jgi:hypothetical protein
MVLLILDCCKSVVYIPLVHWVTGSILRIAMALGALGVVRPPDPSVLLVFVLGSISCGLNGRDIRELLVVVLRVQLVVLHIAKGGHVDLTIRRVVNHKAILE